MKDLCVEPVYHYNYVCSCSANDVCKESKRQIISAEDVFKALEEIDFVEFVGPLRASLEGLCYFYHNGSMQYILLNIEINFI